MIPALVIWEFPLRCLFASWWIIRLIVSRARISISRTYLSLQWYCVMRSFTNACLCFIWSWSKLVVINRRSHMVAILIIMDLPLRISFVNLGIIRVVVARAWVFVIRVHYLWWWYSVVRSLSNVSLRLVVSRTEPIRAYNWSFMIAFWVLRELPLWWLHVSKCAVWIVLARTRILIVWTVVPRWRNGIMRTLSDLCLQVVRARAN